MIWPVVGAMKPRSNMASVVLPLPLSPATVMIVGSSSRSVNERSCSAMFDWALITPRE
jgi:hypothetical protein